MWSQGDWKLQVETGGSIRKMLRIVSFFRLCHFVLNQTSNFDIKSPSRWPVVAKIWPFNFTKFMKLLRFYFYSIIIRKFSPEVVQQSMVCTHSLSLQCMLHILDQQHNRQRVNAPQRETTQMPVWLHHQQESRHTLAEDGVRPHLCHMLIAKEPQVRAQSATVTSTFHSWCIDVSAYC